MSGVIHPQNGCDPPIVIEERLVRADQVPQRSLYGSLSKLDVMVLEFIALESVALESALDVAVEIVVVVGPVFQV